MGFFKRDTGASPRGMTACPVCNEALTKDQAKMHGGHFERHVFQIENGEGAGNYTWQCSCGPAPMHWPNDFAALAGLALHLQQKHGMHGIIG